MLRLSGTAFRSVRLNHALRTPVEGFDQLKFVTEQPNPFHTEQSKVTLNTEQYGTKSIKLITRPALHGIYCTIGLVLGAGSRYAGDLPAGMGLTRYETTYSSSTLQSESRNVCFMFASRDLSFGREVSIWAN